MMRSTRQGKSFPYITLHFIPHNRRIVQTLKNSNSKLVPAHEINFNLRAYGLGYTTRNMSFKINKQLGEKIRRLRHEKRLQQVELADMVGVKPETISNIERGVTDTSVHTAFKIAEALRVHIKELFTFR